MAIVTGHRGTLLKYVMSLAAVVLITVLVQVGPTNGADFVPHLGHSDGVHRAVYSRDGSFIATASGDRTLKLWEARRGLPLRTFRGHTKNVWSVQFSPDGRRLVSSGEDHFVFVWDVSTGASTHTLQGHTGIIQSATFSPDGNRIASGSWDQTIRIWNTQSGATERSISTGTPRGAVITLAFSPGGRHIYAGLADGTVRSWEADTGREVATYTGHRGAVNALVFLPEGAAFITGGGDRSIKLWAVGQGGALQTVTSHSKAVFSLAATPQADAIFSTGEDGALIEHALQPGRLGPPRVLRPPGPKLAYSVAVSNDGARVLWSGTGLEAGVIDPATGNDIGWLRSRAAQPSFFSALDVCADGRHAVVGYWGGQIVFWDLVTGKAVRVLQSGHKVPVAVRLSPSCEELVVGQTGSSGYSVWHIPTGSKLRDVISEEGGNFLRALAFSRDGASVLAGGTGGILRLRELSTGSLVRSFGEYEYAKHIDHIAASSDGQLVAVGYNDGNVRVWRIADGSLIGTFGKYQTVTAVSFSADGRRIVSGGGDRKVRIWDLASGRNLQTFSGHTDEITAAIFLPDDKTIVSSSKDGTIRWWDVASGKPSKASVSHDAGVFGLAAVLGKLVSVSSDSTLRVWHSGTAQEMLRSVISADGAWLSITPSGFFDRGGSGDVPLNIVRNLDVVSADQLFRSLYQPDLVREVLAGDRSGEAAAAARVSDIDKILDHGQTPHVDIRLRDKSSILNSANATVLATIRMAGGGLGRIEWRVNHAYLLRTGAISA